MCQVCPCFFFGWGNDDDWMVVSNIFYFHRYLGSKLIFFKMGWNNELDDFYGWIFQDQKVRSIIVAGVLGLCFFTVVLKNQQAHEKQFCFFFVDTGILRDFFKIILKFNSYQNNKCTTGHPPSNISVHLNRLGFPWYNKTTSWVSSPNTDGSDKENRCNTTHSIHDIHVIHVWYIYIYTVIYLHLP